MAIDTRSFEYADSRLQDLYRHLKRKGFDVYMPDMKKGECTRPYVVVKNDAGAEHTSFSTRVDLYAVMCYVPKHSYSKLEPLVNAVREAMKELEPLFKDYGTYSASYYDDVVKAHMVNIEYKNYKKI